jgi:hypothetical protein
MSVVEAAGGSTVKLVTDYTVAGRVANFGRGVMEDVSRRLVGEMANCIKSHLEAPEQPAPPPAETAAEPVAETAAGQTEQRPAPAPPAAPPQAARPVNALSLFFSVLWDRIKRLFGAGSAR